jgi:hypothetical protein
MLCCIMRYVTQKYREWKQSYVINVNPTLYLTSYYICICISVLIIKYYVELRIEYVKTVFLYVLNYRMYIFIHIKVGIWIRCHVNVNVHFGYRLPNFLHLWYCLFCLESRSEWVIS